MILVVIFDYRIPCADLCFGQELDGDGFAVEAADARTDGAERAVDPLLQDLVRSSESVFLLLRQTVPVMAPGRVFQRPALCRTMAVVGDTLQSSPHTAEHIEEH